MPNRVSPPAVLLRCSVRERGKIVKRTLANLSSLESGQIESLRAILRGETLIAPCDAFEKLRDRQHGACEAIRVAIKRLGFDALLDSRRSRERDLVVAMIAARILEPKSKLATSRSWSRYTLAADLGVEGANEKELCAAMDWLFERQARIEKKLGARHLENGALALYDLSSSYFEGVTCPLAKLGHSRDDPWKSLTRDDPWKSLTRDDAGIARACCIVSRRCRGMTPVMLDINLFRSLEGCSTQATSMWWAMEFLILSRPASMCRECIWRASQRRAHCSASSNTLSKASGASRMPLGYALMSKASSTPCSLSKISAGLGMVKNDRRTWPLLVGTPNASAICLASPRQRDKSGA